MKLQEEIAAMLKDGSPMTRGKLCVSAVRKYRKSTERCKRFLDCVQRYVDMKTKESIRTIRKEAKDARGKAKAARRADG